MKYVEEDVTNSSIIPSAYNNSVTSLGNFTSQNTGNFLANETSTNYAQFSSTSNSTATIYYDVDCSEIPANATITSVTCQVKGGVNNTTYMSTRNCCLCSGTTEKSANYTMTATMTNTFTLTGNNITRADLNNLRIKFTLTRNRNNTTSYYGRFYGARFTIQYTVPVPYYRASVVDYNGTCSSTVEFDEDVIREGRSVSFTFEEIHPSTLKTAKLNGASIQLTKSGDEYTYTVNNVQSDLQFEIMNSIDPVVTVSGTQHTGTKVYKKVNGAWQEIEQKDWPDLLATGGKKRIIKGWR